MMYAIVLSLLLLSAAVARDNQAGTPVDKVIKLLTKLREQVQEEGKVEAASYDRFACFCKDEANNKGYVIKKSDSKIDGLTASIEELGGRISQLDTEVTERQGEVVTERTDAAAAQKVRSEEVKTYQATRTDLAEAVDAVERALETMRASKKGVENAKTAAVFLSMQSTLTKLAASRGEQAPPVFKYQSDAVIATLQDLMKTFKTELAQLDEEAATANHSFDMAEGARANKIRAFEHEIDQKQEESAHHSQEKADNEGLLDEETGERNMDQAFLDELVGGCEKKAAAWDVRSKTRAGEITTLTEALSTLGGMGDLYSVNKKLTGFISTSASLPATHKNVGHWVWVNDDEKANGGLSFLQRGLGRKAAQLKPVIAFLKRQARLLRSAALSTLVGRMNAESGADHFAKVRQIIKDLIKRLEDQALAEADQKSFCDTEMKASIDKRDARQAETEGLQASIDETESVIQQLTGEIASLGEEIAAMHKSLNEMTQLRQTEKAQNEKAVVDAEEGATAIRQALVVLQKFYESDAALVQRYVPPNADREGNTVADLVPETFEGEYQGRVDASKGIIGMLEVIASDFDRTATTTGTAEKEAQALFEEEESNIKKAIETKEGDKSQKETLRDTKTADLTDFKDSLKDATQLHADALEELEKLKTSCVEGEETWEERKERREQEVASLKEALRILEDWEK